VKPALAFRDDAVGGRFAPRATLSFFELIGKLNFIRTFSRAIMLLTNSNFATYFVQISFTIYK
jgi:hypothetical protein